MKVGTLLATQSDGTRMEFDGIDRSTGNIFPRCRIVTPDGVRHSPVSVLGAMVHGIWEILPTVEEAFALAESERESRSAPAPK